VWAIRPTRLSPGEPGIGRIAPGDIRTDACSVSATLPLGAPDRVRVLVVDDNDGFRESLVFLLNGEDLEVIGQARSGTEAIEMVRQLSPDVVLMDVRMPGMDGIEATRRLKASRPGIGATRAGAGAPGPVRSRNASTPGARPARMSAA